MVTVFVSPCVTGGVLTREQESVPDGGTAVGDGGVLSDIIYMLGCGWVTVPVT
jgi:hypothetical protein